RQAVRRRRRKKGKRERRRGPGGAGCRGQPRSDRRSLGLPSGRGRRTRDRRQDPRSRRKRRPVPLERVLGRVRQRRGRNGNRRQPGAPARILEPDRVRGGRKRPPEGIEGRRKARMRMSIVRAGILVTGTEVLTGTIAASTGPWLSERLAELGIDVAHILIVGDRPDDLEAALRFMADEGMDLIVTSGGLGPTADDLTAEIVARFAGRELRLD